MPAPSPDAAAAEPAGWRKLRHDLVHRRRKYRQFLGWLFVFVVTLLGDPGVPALFWAGVAVVALGEGFRLWASGFVHKNKVLTTTGPYARVRHPLYTGNVLIAVGMCLASGVWWSWVAAAVLLLVFYPPAIAYEDRKLRGLFPSEWEPWAAETPALVPRLRSRRASGPWSWSLRRSLLENGEPVYALVLGLCLAWLGRHLGA